MKEIFNNEEITIMSFYNKKDKYSLINNLKNIVIHTEDNLMREEVKEIINKLGNITDEDFKNIKFDNAIEYEED
ncbi:MAG: transposon-transfer assisting family protein [Clostridium sp.]|uniref:transposon-transfer assisting family protein n=1 Tax=Clostridium sp. TaxID=1506 RepID=UPI002A917106|nr:transposon-transfer assisting family protein [Clostridium sp.]MDY6228803.1 transposon-transfer assisting family protein [Clostridium sp.]